MRRASTREATDPTNVTKAASTTAWRTTCRQYDDEFLVTLNIANQRSKTGDQTGGGAIKVWPRPQLCNLHGGTVCASNECFRRAVDAAFSEELSATGEN